MCGVIERLGGTSTDSTGAPLKEGDRSRTATYPCGRCPAVSTATGRRARTRADAVRRRSALRGSGEYSTSARPLRTGARWHLRRRGHAGASPGMYGLTAGPDQGTVVCRARAARPHAAAVRRWGPPRSS
jgi:hypothetical protein